MMYPRYLRHLADDDHDRAMLVETLRASAAMLSGDGLESRLDEPTRTAVAHRLARALRESAYQLCEHARLHGVHCRYCEGIVPEGDYDTDTLARSIDPDDSDEPDLPEVQ